MLKFVGAAVQAIQHQSDAITTSASVSKRVNRATSLLPTKAFLLERDGATLLLKEFEHPWTLFVFTTKFTQYAHTTE